MIWWVILMFLVGITLIMAEFFLPGLICGVLGTFAIIGSCLIALNWHPEWAAMIIVGEILAVLISISIGFYLLANTRVGKALVLNTTQQPDAGWVSDESDTALLGAVGKVYTALRPAGTIMIGGKKISAVSNGNFIEDGASIKVVEVNGNRIVVEPVTPKS